MKKLIYNKKGFIITGVLLAGAGLGLLYLLLGTSGAIIILKYGKYIVYTLAAILTLKVLRICLDK